MHAVATLRATRVARDQRQAIDDAVAVETPIALVYNGVSHAVMMATPRQLDELAIGFSLSEGIVACADEIDLVDIRLGDDGVSVQMAIPGERFAILSRRERNLSARIGCGLCGAESLAGAIRPIAQVSARRIDPDAIDAGLRALPAAQHWNRDCHGLHAAAFVREDALLVREDIGRHNALDKLIGALALSDTVGASGFLLISSRASYEVVHKAASAGIGLVVAISAPTTLAIDLARQAGMALVAFARDQSVTVYNAPAGIA